MRKALIACALLLLAACEPDTLSPDPNWVRLTHTCTLYQGLDGIVYDVCLPR